MTAMSRNKGKDGEREIAAIVRDLTGWCRCALTQAQKAPRDPEPC